MSFDSQGRYVTPELKELAAVKDGGVWKVRTFGYGYPVGADVLPEVRPDCDSAEDNAHLFAAAPEFRRAWEMVHLEMRATILGLLPERARELIEKASTSP